MQGAAALTNDEWQCCLECFIQCEGLSMAVAPNCSKCQQHRKVPCSKQRHAPVAAEGRDMAECALRVSYQVKLLLCQHRSSVIVIVTVIEPVAVV